MAATKKFIASKTSKPRDGLPWITPSLKKMMRRRDKMFQKHKTSNKYKTLKRETQQGLRKTYWDYIEKVITPSDQNPINKANKKFWTYIKHCKSNNSGISPLKENGILHSDPQKKADILNNQFKSVFTKDLDSATDNTPQSDFPILDDICITEPGVLKLLQNLDPTKASGPDNISPKILKELANEIAPSLTLIFKKSYDTGMVPADWRHATVAPIFKKGEKYVAANYRPVSLTCIASKIMEHIVTSQIMKHSNTHNILYPLQHGFRSRLSCETQLVEFVSDVTNNMQTGAQTDVIVMDFSKAFDKVSHLKLKEKLHRYGICGKTNNWISAFLANRSQAVVVEGEASQVASVDSGVPQGSVLCPSLFLFYINDIPENIQSTVRLFADDTIVYIALKPPSNAKTLQQDLEKLGEWEQKWKMEFHPDKCEVIPITRNRTPIINKYVLHNHTLNTTKNAKYLGVTITSDLNWNTHIDNITAKANRTLGFIRRNIRISSPTIKTLAYNSLVRPLLEYASPVWDPYTKLNIDKIEMVQRRAARFATNRYHNTSSVTNMLSTLQWRSLADRRVDARLCLMFKIVHGLVEIPHQKYLIPFTRSSRIHHNLAFQIPHSKADYHLFSFFPRTIRVWNTLPLSFVNSPNIEIFKTKVQTLTHATI